jgi:hypothetical protein
MNFTQAQQDWEHANQTGLTIAVVLEQGLLTGDNRQSIADKQVLHPLLSHPNVAHLTTDGPAIVDLTGKPFTALKDLPQSAIHGWLTTPLSSEALAAHLADALVCRDSHGETLLIRSYASSVLPHLHARTEQPWHSWLFDAIEHWWLSMPEGFQLICGRGLSSIPDYAPITLDTDLEQALGQHAQAQVLLAQLLENAPKVFNSDCHGERLQQIEQQLAIARQAKLSLPADQNYFVLHSMLSARPLHEQHNWPQVLQLLEQGQPLADVICEQEAAFI